MSACSVCRDLQAVPGVSVGSFIAAGQGAALAESARTCRHCSILHEGSLAFAPAGRQVTSWVALGASDEDLLRLQYSLDGDSEYSSRRGVHFYIERPHHDNDDGATSLTKPSTPAASTGKLHPYSDVMSVAEHFEADTACTKYLGQMKSWVNDCTKNHAECSTWTSGYLPTRVLDVSRCDDRIFLHETVGEGETGTYNALSHCWGKVIPIKTTFSSKTIFEQDGIPLYALPKTFQEAVLVTRELQCPYLWIDSLCIIQDSKEDWQKEASHMADVYGNSFVTLIASASFDSRGGLFYCKDENEVKHTIHRTDENGTPFKIHVRPALDHSPYFSSGAYGLEPSSQAPLLSRCWCFQEYLLSPRVLSFTKMELLWECRRRPLCNCGVFGANKRDDISPGNLKTRFAQELNIVAATTDDNGDGGSSSSSSSSSSSPPSPSPSLVDVLGLWRDIVQVYSQKQLSFDSDRLPALSGIARMFVAAEVGRRREDDHNDKEEKKKSTGLSSSPTPASLPSLGRYVNGHWLGLFASELLWRVDWLFVDTHGVVTRRSTHGNAPSWSWTSVFTPVSNNSSLSTAAQLGFDILHVQGSLPLSSFVGPAGIDSVGGDGMEGENERQEGQEREEEEDGADVDTLSSITAGAITLRGRLSAAVAWRPHDKSQSNVVRKLRVPGLPAQDWYADVASECVATEDAPMDVHVLWLLDRVVGGLVLRRAEEGEGQGEKEEGKGEGERFRRLGAIDGYDPKRPGMKEIAMMRHTVVPSVFKLF